MHTARTQPDFSLYVQMAHAIDSQSEKKIEEKTTKHQNTKDVNNKIVALTNEGLRDASNSSLKEY